MRWPDDMIRKVLDQKPGPKMRERPRQTRVPIIKQIKKKQYYSPNDDPEQMFLA